MRRIACTLALWALASAPALAQIAVKDRTIGRSTAKLEIDVHVPVTGMAGIDRLFADYAQARIREIGQPGPEDTRGLPYSVNLGYTLTRNDAKFFAVLFAGDQYSGGAHPSHWSQSFIFLMPDGARTFLPELVDARGMARISQLAIADLGKRLLAGPDAMTNADWIKSGATPAALAQLSFEWKPRELVLHFDEYAVAPYAAGPQEVRIPMTAIAAFVRPDPRAPQPSFDCARAASRIEKAICANAALARQDRQVAESYALKRELTSDAKERGALLAAQRAWLAARDKACGTGDAACLAKSYGARLAVLNRPPS